MAGKKMGVVGQRDVVAAFGAMGMEAKVAETKETVAAAVHALAMEGIPVIFITEQAAQLSAETMEKYRASDTTLLIPVPSSMGSDGYGIRRIAENVEKAIGADIFFEKEGEDG